MDIVNNFRLDAGNYYRGAMIGSMIRYGNNYPNNFNTVGRYLGANENKLLNLDSKQIKILLGILWFGICLYRLFLCK